MSVRPFLPLFPVFHLLLIFAASFYMGLNVFQLLHTLSLHNVQLNARSRWECGRTLVLPSLMAQFRLAIVVFADVFHRIINPCNTC